MCCLRVAPVAARRLQRLLGRRSLHLRVVQMAVRRHQRLLGRQSLHLRVGHVAVRRLLLLLHHHVPHSPKGLCTAPLADH